MAEMACPRWSTSADVSRQARAGLSMIVEAYVATDDNAYRMHGVAVVCCFLLVVCCCFLLACFAVGGEMKRAVHSVLDFT